jgi:hypothetical protein
MHRQVNSLLSNGGSPGKLAQYTRELATQGVNIRSIGGAEWGGTGAVAVLVDEGTNEVQLAEALTAAGFESVPIYAAEAIMPDEPGALAGACEAIGDLNIASILVADTHGGVGLVTFGFESQDDAREAERRLGDIGVKPHKLTRAWQAHEDWDATNPNPRPNPRDA